MAEASPPPEPVTEGLLVEARRYLFACEATGNGKSTCARVIRALLAERAKS